MSFNGFDDLDPELQPRNALKPFFTVDLNNDELLLKWLKHALAQSQQKQRAQFEKMRDNLALYRGLSRNGIARTTSTARTSEGVVRSVSPRLKINHLFDITENLVSKLNRIKPAVEVLPTNDEYSDKTAAKSVKFLIEHLWHINDMDRILQQHHRIKHIMGESYLFILWDEEKGDFHPDYIRAKHSGESLLQLDEKGEPVLDEHGNPKQIDMPVRVGDICYELELPFNVILEDKEKWEDIGWIIRVQCKHVEEVKKEHPNKAKLIKADSGATKFDMESFEKKPLEDHVMVYEMYHKQSKFVPAGRYIKFCETAILENKELPYSHGELPVERITDIDIPQQLRGMSFYQIVEEIQKMHNNLSSQIAKNFFLASHPKWVMPRGAAKIESLGNDITVVQYQGAVPPQLVTMNTTGSEVFNFRDALEKDMQKLSNVFGISRGEPPKGVTAAVAMQFLNEQEIERSTTSIAKHNNMVKNIARKTIATAGDYYDPSDGRLLRILGKDNAHLLRAFEASDLHRAYDIRINTSSALPQSKAGRLEKIIQVMQFKPDLLEPERWVELLEFGSDDQMHTLITQAIRAAESENEDLLQGLPVAPPEEWEDHILHWQTHIKKLQSRFFKEEVPNPIKMEFIKHIELTEYLMSEKAKVNPLFQAKIAQLPLFPVFYQGGATPQSAQQQEVMAQGAANRGEPTDAQIPAEEAGVPGESPEDKE